MLISAIGRRDVSARRRRKKIRSLNIADDKMGMSAADAAKRPNIVELNYVYYRYSNNDIMMNEMFIHYCQFAKKFSALS